mmetsp:Transcript_7063/g.15186  ORF Transcript_7063/g.15186 Transcript_7063/m.15186 type:complete len:108 (+) Transcript_7063:111-434(+)
MEASADAQQDDQQRQTGPALSQHAPNLVSDGDVVCLDYRILLHDGDMVACRECFAKLTRCCEMSIDPFTMQCGRYLHVLHAEFMMFTVICFFVNMNIFHSRLNLNLS